MTPIEEFRDQLDRIETTQRQILHLLGQRSTPDPAATSDGDRFSSGTGPMPELPHAEAHDATIPPATRDLGLATITKLRRREPR